MLRVSEQAFRTDTGRQRTANEDSFFASAPLFAVADGMGGAKAGEVASRIAAEAFEAAERGGESPESFLRSIAESANQSIHGLAQHDSSRSGMGTTLTSALVEGDDVAFAHVGDSRAYVLRDDVLRQLTADHSLVEELRRQGRLTSEQAEDHPQRSIITRALGPEREVEIDSFTFSARPDDVFLLCSDGLTTMIKEEAIAEILRSASSLKEAVSQLLEAANEAGGRDNITALAFRLEETDEAATDSSATLIGPSAEEAGLSAERVRASAAGRTATTAEPHGPPKRRPLKTAAKVLVVLAILAGIGIGAYYGVRQFYFLGIDEGGRVALYRGLPYDLPLDARLYSEVTSAAFQADTLPDDRRDEATDHELRSRSDAVSLLEDLEAAAVAETPTTPTPSQPNSGDQSNPPSQGNQQDTVNGGKEGGSGGGASPSGGAGTIDQSGTGTGN